jgi:hypothetical protein
VNDHRAHPRIAVRYQVTFSASVGAGVGYILNLSLEGCSMETSPPIPQRSYVQLRIIPADGDTPILVELAAVRWVHERECGIQFLSIRADQRDRLRMLLHQLQSYEPPVS